MKGCPTQTMQFKGAMCCALFLVWGKLFGAGGRSHIPRPDIARQSISRNYPFLLAFKYVYEDTYIYTSKYLFVSMHCTHKLCPMQRLF